jgi:predicted nucleic acid-binding protein
MAASYLLDTDVLIDYLRGHERAVRFLETAAGDLHVSSISVAELYAGVKGEEEDRSLQQFLSAFIIVPIDQAIARAAGLYRQLYRQSHGTSLADALIAASSEAQGATLVSLNRRHYPKLRRFKVPYRRG